MSIATVSTQLEQTAKRNREWRKREKADREKAARDPALLAERLTGHPADNEARRHVEVKRRDRNGVLRSTGTRVLVRRNGYWLRETATCSLVPAKLSDFEGNPPPDFTTAPRFGADPVNYPRPALGTVEPVRRVRRINERGIEVTSPIPVGKELDAALAAGGQLVPTRRA